MSRINNRSLLSRIGLLSAIALLLAGCASGPPFTQAEPSPPGKAAIYVYRPSAFVQSGNIYAVSFVPTAQTLKLRNGSWIQAVLPPGHYNLDAIDQFGAMRCGSLSLNLAAGETTYAMLDVSLRSDGSGSVHTCRLAKVASDSALQVMAGMPRSE